MNYNSKGGQPHGLKAIAQELTRYGRNGDTILAHINPTEAELLKKLGGSGSINPVTGLPEYFKIGNVFKPVTQAWKAVTNLPVIKQVSDVVTPALQAVAPYAQYIAPFIPGVGPLMAAGLGALGSGFAGKGGFNFKRGLMGGLTAYGLANLYAGLQAAGGSLPGATTATGTAPATSSAAEMANVALAEGAPTAGMVTSQPGIASQVMAGDLGAAATQFGEKAATMGTDFANQMSAAGQGIQNLTGVGAQTVPLGEAVTGSKAAMASLGKEFGTGSATAIGMGVMGTASLDEEQKYLDQQKAAGTIADTEYQEGIARIQAARARAEQAVRDNPYQFAEGGEVPGYAIGGGIAGVMERLRGADGPIGKIIASLKNQTPTPEQVANTNKTELATAGIRQNILDSANTQQLQDYLNAMRKSEDEKSAYRAMINNPYQYAVGGSVDDEPGMDSARGLDRGNMEKGLFGMGYAVGGQPRFLSGGGDGMSDSIQATINDKQPARLADGEFVVPADVVSNLGNGSSKAGAKRLYGMMDRVRKSRTGTTKQAKAINPAKVMPA